MTTTTVSGARTRFSTTPRETTAARRKPARRPTVAAGWIAPFAWMTVVAITVGAFGSIAMLRDGVPSAASATRAVRVAPSDTLWSIAAENRLPGVSTVRTVEAITRINGLEGTAIHAGATLRVPVLEVADAAFAQAEVPTAIR